MGPGHMNHFIICAAFGFLQRQIDFLSFFRDNRNIEKNVDLTRNSLAVCSVSGSVFSVGV